jgi:hypothetical protein
MLLLRPERRLVALLQPACNLEIGDLADKLNNAVDVLRSFGTAATFDILVARIQTTGTRGARLARVKPGCKCLL